MDLNLYNSILADIWSYDLVLVGILVSIFVLLYSFVSNKRDTLREISIQIKREGVKNNPLLQQKENNAKVYINNMRNVNKHCIWLLLISVIHLFVTWGFFRVVPDTQYQLKKIGVSILGIIVVLLTISIIIQMVTIYRHYKKYTKI